MKRTLSKVLSCILAVMMVLSVVSVGAFAATGCGEGKHVSDGKVYGTDSGKYCYDYSFVTYKCVVCNQYYAVYTRALNAACHSASDDTVIKHAKVNATCKALGTEEYYECTVCGWKSTDGTAAGMFTDMKTVEIAKVTAHNYVADLKSIVAPKISGTTYTKGSMNYVCSICGDSKKITITCNHENDYDSTNKKYNYNTTYWTKLTNSDTVTNYVKESCTANGYQKWQCKECGLVLTQTLSKGHSQDSATYKMVPATCTTEGYESYVCSECKVTVTTTLAKLNHKDGSKSKLTETKATCTKNSQWYCSLCETTYDHKQLNGVDNMLNHPGKVALTDSNVKSAICGKDIKYYAAYYCATCAKNSQNVTVTGAVIPEYKVDGKVQTYGFVWLEEATGTTHNFTYKVWEGTVGSTTLKKTTCVADGYYVLQCTKCEKYADANGNAAALASAKVYTEAKSDDYHNKFEVSIIIAANCSNPGERQIACTYCSKLDGTREVIPATGHKGNGTVRTIREATCLETGAEVQSCSVCKQEFIVSLKALDHDYSKEYAKVAATCTTVGYSAATKYCSRCGTLKTPGNLIAAKDHTYVYVDHVQGKDETAAKTCTTKGFTVNSGAASGKGWYCNVKNCGATDGTIVTACENSLGHNASYAYETVSGKTACGTVNYVTYICSRCGFNGGSNKIVKFKQNAAHTLVAVAATTGSSSYYVEDLDRTVVIGSGAQAKVDASCATIGFTIVKCSTCGNYYSSNKVAKLAHVNKAGQSFNEVVDSTAILCVEGVTDYVCVNACCKENKTQKNYAEFVKHGAEAVKTAQYAPTCTTPGYEVLAYECCHTYFTNKIAEQISHSMVDNVVAGVVVSKSCSACGYTVVLKAAELEYVYEIKANAVNNGKLAVTVSVKATSSAISVWSVSDKFNVPAGFTFDKAVAANGIFDVVSAVYGQDTHVEKTKVGEMNNVVYYEDKTIVDDRYVTFVARNSKLANVTVNGTVELATIYFDIADDAVAYGTASTEFDFVVKPAYKTSKAVSAATAAGKEISITGDDYSGVAFKVTVYNLGDINHDGYVNILDFAKVLAAFDAFADAADMPEADINCDGVIDAADVALIEKFVTGAITYEQMIAG